MDFPTQFGERGLLEANIAAANVRNAGGVLPDNTIPPIRSNMIDSATWYLATNSASTSGITTNYTVPGGATFYITNGVIMKVQ